MLVVEASVGQVKGGTDGAVLPTEFVEPGVRLTQPLGQGGHGPGRGVGEQGGGDPQCEGQPCAQVGDDRSRLRVVVDAGVCRPAGLPQGVAEQLRRGKRVQDGQLVKVGTDIENVTGCDQGRRAAVRRQQRVDLLSGGGVVQNHQDPSALLGEGGQHAAVQPGAVLQVTGDVLARYAQGAQQIVQRLLGSQPALRIVAEQVDHQHTTGEPTGLVPRPGRALHGQFGLAHPGQTRDEHWLPPLRTGSQQAE
ncbi:hypothetical protein SUDANB1_01020 [Streptomyces sp. enrichment culture]